LAESEGSGDFDGARAAILEAILAVEEAVRLTN
jgi:hypothetical protein